MASDMQSPAFRRHSVLSVGSLLNPEPTRSATSTSASMATPASAAGGDAGWRRHSVPSFAAPRQQEMTFINYYRPQDGIPNETASYVNGSASSSTNMITPPQTPGMTTPTRATFQIPATAQVNSQPQAQKAKRKRITPEQLQELLATFEHTDTPSYEIREKLAQKLGMTNREVQVWFQNRRAKTNRQKANEHNASQPHHRFLHHQPVSTARAAGGHASSVSHHGGYTFVPVFTNGVPNSGAGGKGRARRHSYVQPSSNQIARKTRPRATTVSGGDPSVSSAPSKMPPPIKITPHGSQDRYRGQNGPVASSQIGQPYQSPMTPISPGSSASPPISPVASVSNKILPPPIARRVLPEMSAYGSQPVNIPAINTGENSAIGRVLPPVQLNPSNTQDSAQASQITPRRASLPIQSEMNSATSYNDPVIRKAAEEAMMPASGSAIDILATAANLVRAHELNRTNISDAHDISDNHNEVSEINSRGPCFPVIASVDAGSDGSSEHGRGRPWLL